eukprot:9284734-Karenia_brevis.AAC.1
MDVYDILHEMVAEGRCKGFLPFLGGDWNAEIGGMQPGEDSQILGPFAQGIRNDRGNILAKWVWTHSLAVANTFFRTSWEGMWTHIYDGRERVIDFFCVDVKMMPWLIDSGVCLDVNLGSDHRGISATLLMKGKKEKGQRPKK